VIRKERKNRKATRKKKRKSKTQKGVRTILRKDGVERGEGEPEKDKEKETSSSEKGVDRKKAKKWA